MSLFEVPTLLQSEKELKKLDKCLEIYRKATAMHLNAGEMLAFTKASIQIMDHLVKHKAHAGWVCWTKLVALVRFSVRHSFQRCEADKLDASASCLIYSGPNEIIIMTT